METYGEVRGAGGTLAGLLLDAELSALAGGEGPDRRRAARGTSLRERGRGRDVDRTRRLMVADWLSLGGLKRCKIFAKLGKYRLRERKGRRQYDFLSKLKAFEIGY